MELRIINEVLITENSSEILINFEYKTGFEINSLLKYIYKIRKSKKIYTDEYKKKSVAKSFAGLNHARKHFQDLELKRHHI